MSCLNLLRSLSRMKFAVITKAEMVHRVRGSDRLPNHVFTHWEIRNSVGKWTFNKLLAHHSFLELEGSNMPCFDFLTLPSDRLAWRVCCLLVCQEKKCRWGSSVCFVVCTAHHWVFGHRCHRALAFPWFSSLVFEQSWLGKVNISWSSLILIS